MVWINQAKSVLKIDLEITTKYYDNNSAVIGSNLDYAAIHQLGRQAGRNKKADCEQSAKRSGDTFNASNQAVTIPARLYLKLADEDFGKILDMTENFIANIIK